MKNILSDFVENVGFVLAAIGLIIVGILCAICDNIIDFAKTIWNKIVSKKKI